jgi:hypothetical protein
MKERGAKNPLFILILSSGSEVIGWALCVKMCANLGG